MRGFAGKIRRHNMAMIENLTVHKKIALAIIKNRKEGDVLNRQEIIKIVQKEYPEIPASSIIPSDLCENKKNKDPQSGIHHVFHYESRNRYWVLSKTVIKLTCKL